MKGTMPWLLIVVGAGAVPSSARAQPPPNMAPAPAPNPAAAPQPNPATANPQITLTDAVHYAVSRNERAHISDLSVDVADAAVERARDVFLPVLTATGNDQQHVNGPPHTGLVGNVATTAITLNQPLLNASAFPLYAQAKALADAQRAQNIDDKRLLAFNAATAYFAVLNAGDVVAAADLNVKGAEAALADAKGRAQNGLTSTNDVTRANIEVAGAQREIEVDKGLLDNGYVQLAFILNYPVPSGSLARPADALADAQKPVPATDWLLQFAAAHRPDIQVAKHQLTAAQDFASEPLLRLVPTVGLVATANGTTNTPPSGLWYDAFVGATATWTIFDNGSRYADKHSRDAQADIADLNLQQLLRSVEAGVRSAVALLVSSQAAYRQAVLAEAAAKQSVEETVIIYNAGKATMLERTDANDTYFGAQVTRANAEFAMSQAYLALRQALGLQPLGTGYQ